MDRNVKISLLIFLFYIFFCLTAYTQDGYKIRIKVKNIQDSTITLAHYFADKTFIDTKTNFDKKGIAVFTGEKKLHQGLYLLILPGNNYLELIMDEKQHCSFELDTSDIVGSMVVKDSPENLLFYNSQKYLKEKRKTVDKLLKRKKEDKTADTIKINEEIKSIENELDQSWRKLVKDNPDYFYAKLLNAMNGNEGQFFDNVDFSDNRLLFSNVIYTTTRRVMARDLNANKATTIIIENTDKLLIKAKANKEVFEYVFSYMLSFYNSFARIGINEVFAHLVDNYVKTGQTTWYDSTSVSEIKKRADVLTAGFEGKIAPDLKFMNIITGDSISIHQVQAKYTILFFWSPGCGHCKNAAEKMRDFIADGKKDLKVFGVCTKEKSGGLTFISENKLENFINCIDEKNKSDYFSFYYVVSTPVAFLLDRNKRIIAKKAGDTGIMDMVKQLEEQKDKF